MSDVVYVFAYFPRYALRLLGGAAATLLAFAFGPTPGQVAAAGQQWSSWAVTAVGDLIARIVPKTTRSSVAQLSCRGPSKPER